MSGITSYSEILTDICDYYDEEIKPKKIRRSDNNAIYQAFKSVAKGYEVIASSKMLLDNKFDPERCSESDLESTAKLVGTKRREGKSSGLVLHIQNPDIEDVTLVAGEYFYIFDADTRFTFNLSVDNIIEAGTTRTFFSFSNRIGSFMVTASAVTLHRNDSISVPSSIKVTCEDNSTILGFDVESILDFRKRLVSDHTRQDALSEIENEIRNLPYIFDCKLFFNQTFSPATIDGITVSPFCALLVLNGDVRDEVASVYCSKAIYETTQINPEDVVLFYSTCLKDGHTPVYFKRFEDLNYEVEINYAFDDKLTTSKEIKEHLNAALNKFIYNNQHKKAVTETDIYNAIWGVALPSFELRFLNLLFDSGSGLSKTDYIPVPVTRVPKLTNIQFQETTL